MNYMSSRAPKSVNAPTVRKKTTSRQGRKIRSFRPTKKAVVGTICCTEKSTYSETLNRIIGLKNEEEPP